MSNDIRGIVFVGEPGSGKTSISEELMKLLGWDRLSFAAPLKVEVAGALADQNVSWIEHMDAMADPERKDAYRTLLQAWGSFRRSQDADHWVNKLQTNMIPGEHYVVDDCRYWNEYHFLRDRGFKFVALFPGETTRHLTNDQAAHESERDWPGFHIDMFLSYEAGPRHQAERVAEAFGLIEDAQPECDCDVCQEAYEPSCGVDGCDCDCAPPLSDQAIINDAASAGLDGLPVVTVSVLPVAGMVVDIGSMRITMPTPKRTDEVFITPRTYHLNGDTLERLIDGCEE